MPCYQAIGKKRLINYQNLQTSFVDEMKKFDLERALKAWDCLVTSQQRTLEELGIPGMFVTTDKSEREVDIRPGHISFSINFPLAETAADHSGIGRFSKSRRFC